MPLHLIICNWQNPTLKLAKKLKISGRVRTHWWLIRINNVENVVIQSRTGLQIYEGRDDQLNRPEPRA
jgi:hypothetical protein